MKTTRWALALAAFAATWLVGGTSRAGFETLGPTTSFENPDLTDVPSPVYSGIGTNSISWGDPDGFGTGPNTFEFVPDGAASPSPDGDLYVLGRLNYFNGTVSLGTSIRGVDLMTKIDPSPAPSVPLDVDTFTFPIAIVTTPNVEGDPDASADYIYFKGTNVGLFHVFENTSASVDVIVRYTPGDIGPLSNGFSVQGGGGTLTVVKFANVSAGGFVTAAVPEPSSLAIFGLGIAGVVAGHKWRNRRRVAA